MFEGEKTLEVALSGEIDIPVITANNSNRHGRVSNEKRKQSPELADVPEKLLEILNDDFVFQVKDWLIRLDFKGRRVYVIQAKDRNRLYREFLAGTDIPEVYRFSMDFETFRLLDEGFTRDPEDAGNFSGRTEFIFCGGGLPAGGTNTGWVTGGSIFAPPSNQPKHKHSIQCL